MVVVGVGGTCRVLVVVSVTEHKDMGEVRRGEGFGVPHLINKIFQWTDNLKKIKQINKGKLVILDGTGTKCTTKI